MLRKLVKELKGALEFALASQVLARARHHAPGDIWIVQQLALCAYKDEERPPATRFAEALALLEGIGLRDPGNRNAETLALGGAVYKRRWEQFGKLEDLHEALVFYRAAYERNPEEDMGYGGVNAAFVLDRLAARAASVAARTGTDPVEAEALRAKARALREDMAVELPRAAERNPALEGQYWYVATLAEIQFGLGNYTQAGEWLAKARNIETKEWERQTTFRQLVTLARLQGIEAPIENRDSVKWHPAWQALAELLGEETELALSCYRGKVGLALSGGGFRASFFHLGVLARLAETDVLRSVEVLSTVSGGSIVGAHYYLAVRHWLQSHPDRGISRSDYLAMVSELQKQFLAGVQRNPRMQVLARLGENLRMIFRKDRSRSHRLGEIFEEALYGRVADGHLLDQPRVLAELLIKPAGESDPDSFKPRFSNWRRRARVPALLLNATSLNTGHAWQFSARWMGEPPGLIGTEVDVNERLRRPYYRDMPTEALRQYRLGHAVAASACVPGLFEPLVIEGLYPERTVRLVDGGVHDNQGVAGLLDEGCTLILCSDASGQMDDQSNPSDRLVGVPLRANSILMKRVRDIQYQDLVARLDSRAIEGLFFVHLKKDLASEPLDWIGSDEPRSEPQHTGQRTPYGVDRDLQSKLAALRTDLDSFTEVEAHALMLSGYLMTEHQFRELQQGHEKEGQPGTWGDYDVGAPRGDWSFLALEELLGQPPDSPDVRRKDLGLQLQVGAARLFKVWRLVPAFRVAGWAALIAALLAIATLTATFWNTPLPSLAPTLGALVLILALIAAGLMVPALKWVQPERAMRGHLRKGLIAVAGFVASRVHLAFFDRLYLARGRVGRLLGLK
ncbi:patatin-like phospholipase family protein [Thioalkalivibrio nitratireducens]|uniref:patatin-like phospholipase family protein n=1 Tax=Thioalkalivibrio nitratireducens TaxID=186931 RepID=UPI001B80D8A5|nr:patatin-like phospholipase family protein [Thioalkalivibrio nitratireducens]